MTFEPLWFKSVLDDVDIAPPALLTAQRDVLHTGGVASAARSPPLRPLSKPTAQGKRLAHSAHSCPPKSPEDILRFLSIRASEA